jgi:hypothetical protein
MPRASAIMRHPLARLGVGLLLLCGLTWSRTAAAAAASLPESSSRLSGTSRTRFT